MEPLIHLPFAAIGAASLVCFVAGFLWFSPFAFFPLWWRAMGKGDQKPGEGGPGMGVLFGSTLIGIVVQATVLERTLAAIGARGPLQGLAWGLALGIGVAAAPSLGHRLFAGQGFRVWLLEVGSDVLNFALMGAVLGWMIAR